MKTIFSLKTLLLAVMIVIGSMETWGATPYVMSTGNYSEGFDDIANWTDNFASGIGAGYWASVAVNTTGIIGDGIKTTHTTNVFKTLTSGGVQKGTTNIYLLSTSTANACAIDLLLDFTGRNAGTISFDVATVFNNTGDRDSKLKLFYSVDGTTFTELTGTNLPFTARNFVASGATISDIALPAAFNNSATARLRFYEHSTFTGATPTGSQPKISIDNILITSLAGDLTAPALTADATDNTVDNNLDITFMANTAFENAITYVRIDGSILTAPTDYEITAGQLRLKPSGGNSLLTIAGSKLVTIDATGYSSTSVTQNFNAGIPTANSTSTINAFLSPGNTSIITCMAKDQYNNAVAGYTFKFNVVVTNDNSVNSEVYTVGGTSISTTTSSIAVATVTDASGNATFNVVLPAVIDGNDGISIQIKLNDGITNVSLPFAFTQLQSQTIPFNAFSSVIYGAAAIILPEFASSGLVIQYTSTNSNVASVSGNILTILGAGSSDIKATQLGNATYNQAFPVTHTLVVSPKQLSIPDAMAQNKVYNGEITAVITGTLSGIINSDDVTLTLKGNFQYPIVGNNIAVTSISTLGGTKAGNYTLLQPTGLTANITKAPQTITFGTLAIKTEGESAFMLTATSSSNLPISYESSNLNVATVLNDMVTIVGSGTTTIKAKQAGNENYDPAPDVSQLLTVNPLPIAAWNFYYVGTTPDMVTFAATTFNSNLISTGGSNNITRGPDAAWSSGGNSFRTLGFKNDGISVSNTDYFQITIKPNLWKKVSLTSIDANLSGTSTFWASPGVSSQFAYSLNGIDFTLIGAPFIHLTSPSAIPQIDLSGIAALQNVAAGTTITLRYYASGQTTTGGWGFNSASFDKNGLAIGGTFTNDFGLPQVTTTAPSSLSMNSATLNGTITVDGGTSITSRGFSYKNVSGVIITDNQTPEGSTGMGTFSKGITGLSPNTQYFYKAWAENSVGATLSDTEISFYTLAAIPNAPAINNATTSTMDITIDINGNPDWTTYAIQETGTSKYVQADGSLGVSPVWQTAAGWGTKTVTGLLGNTAYTFKVKAKNGDNIETTFSLTTALSTLVPATPTLSVGLLEPFENQCLNVLSTADNFTLTGTNLTAVNVTVGALDGFTYSTDDINYTSSLTLVPLAGNINQQIYVKFLPATLLPYNGNIVISGGGAPSVNRSVSGTVVNTLPSVTTSAAASITAIKADLYGEVTDAGCQPITERGFWYGTSVNPETSGTRIVKSGTTGTFNSPVSPLLPNTLYHYRAFATSNSGTNYGEDVTFTTSNLDAPTAQPASNIGSTEFTSQWNLIDGATNYKLDVSKGSSFLNTKLSEDFSGCSDGSIATPSPIDITSISMDPYLQTTGWSGTRINPAGGLVRLGGGSVQGSISTPTINLSENDGNVRVTFDLLKYLAEVGLVQVYHAPDGNTFTQVGSDLTPPTTITNQSISFTGGTVKSKIKITAATATNNRFFLDNILVQQNLIIPGYDDLTVNTATQLVTGLLPNTLYSYRVRAVGGNSTSINSTIISLTTLANVPAAPVVSNPTFSSLAVAVAPNANPAITEFAIQETGSSNYVQGDGSLGVTPIWKTASAWSTIPVVGLSANTSYTFKTKARNSENIETAFGSTATLSTSIVTGLSGENISLKVTVLKDKIQFSAQEGCSVEVYNGIGQKLVQKLTVEGLNTISVTSRGVLLVKVGNRVTKIIL